MRINVNFAVSTDVIEFKPFMGLDINKYKEAFERWYFKEELVNEVPIYVNQVNYKYFDAKPIVDWLNMVAPNCNARIVQYNIPPEEEDKTLPGMYF